MLISTAIVDVYHIKPNFLTFSFVLLYFDNHLNHVEWFIMHNHDGEII